MGFQPYASANARSLEDRSAEDRSAKDPFRRRMILLVEDEPFVREATRSILQQQGFEVLSAENPQDALKIYQECGHGIDLLMTDMVLPGGTGYQLGHDLREHSPQIMVLVTSGYDMHEHEIEAPNSCTYFLAKPYSRRTLVEKIEKILATAPLRRPASQAG
jgi:DNA-binding NtrC family response regulator